MAATHHGRAVPAVDRFVAVLGGVLAAGRDLGGDEVAGRRSREEAPHEADGFAQADEIACLAQEIEPDFRQRGRVRRGERDAAPALRIEQQGRRRRIDAPRPYAQPGNQGRAA